MNETRKRQERARKLIQLTTAFMDISYELEAEARRKAAAGLEFADADFTGVAGLEHLDAARVNAGYATVAQIVTALRNAEFDKTLEALRG